MIVDCRVWSYEGKEYTEPPKELIINAILKAIYSENTTDSVDQAKTNTYKLPDNLKRFFDSLEKKHVGNQCNGTTCFFVYYFTQTLQ